MFGESISDNFLGMREVVKCGTNLVPEWGSTKTKSQLFVRTWNRNVIISNKSFMGVPNAREKKGRSQIWQVFEGFPEKMMKT